MDAVPNIVAVMSWTTANNQVKAKAARSNTTDSHLLYVVRYNCTYCCEKDELSIQY